MFDIFLRHVFPLSENSLADYGKFLENRLGEEPSRSGSPFLWKNTSPFSFRKLPRKPEEPITPWLTRSLDEHQGFPLLLAEFLAHQAAGVYNEGELANDGYLKKIQHHSETCHEDRFVHKNADAYGFVFEDHAFLVFRGTDGLNVPDWWHNLKAKRGPYIFQRDKFFGGAKPVDETPQALHDVHYGFCEHLSLIKWQVDAWIDNLPNHVEKIICTGHSLGGALAVLMAQLLNQRGKDVVMVQTFGAPAVGGESFAQSYTLEDKTWTVINGSDPVANETTNKVGFIHVGKQIHVSSNAVREHFDESHAQGMAEAVFLNLISIGSMISVIAGGLAKFLGPKIARIAHGAPAHSMTESYIASIEDLTKHATRDVDPKIIQNHRRYCGLPINWLDMIKANRPKQT